MPPVHKSKVKLEPSHLFDALILGAGPAGLSAALSLCRVNRTAAVFSTPEFRNDSAHRAHTILSRDHTPPAAIRQAGRDEIDAYGTTKFIDRAVNSAIKSAGGNSFQIVDSEGETWRGRRLILATGVRDLLRATIAGYRECWGRDITQCLFCDGLERAHIPAGVLGFSGPMTLHGISMLFHMGCPQVTIFANGKLEVKDDATRKALSIAKAEGVVVDERKVERFQHLPDGEGMEIHFVDGKEPAHIGFLLDKPSTELNAAHIARDLGLEIQRDATFGDEMLRRDEPFGESNIKGVFVAGDAGTPFKQVTTAMFHGTMAGVGVNMQLVAEEQEISAKDVDGEANEPDDKITELAEGREKDGGEWTH
ncbi:hypothetical protein KC343_g13108 [Hortaea werneckii]|nr:hypothetical protein KC352_g26698 [Hortaea werneckii]KAI7558411.1 hypothetical protein KC317_g11021 [Hortaea werneckii]KAI7605208.1 hypothetical protein KC346_g11126 [Hortaea werneckii]KAI7607347.1 hypothetical protein KC343_g13108 [Hortaea werneckii]KAI7668567.1 hypothetical protein KC319_g6343 [Hortaea werneckii]